MPFPKTLFEIQSRFLQNIKAIVDRRVFVERAVRLPLNFSKANLLIQHEGKLTTPTIMNLSETGIALKKDEVIKHLPRFLTGKLSLEGEEVAVQIDYVRENDQIIAYTFHEGTNIKHLLQRRIPLEMIGSKMIFIKPQGKEIDPINKYWFFSPDVGELFFEINFDEITRLNLTFRNLYFEYLPKSSLLCGKTNDHAENHNIDSDEVTISMSAPNSDQKHEARRVITGIQGFHGDLREKVLKILG